MAFEDELEPDWLYELPFYLTALVLYGALFTLNPALRWGSRERAPDRVVPIEFVAAAPAPSAELAPAPPGDGRNEAPPQKGAGEYEPEKVKAGAPDAPPQPLPNPKPAPPPAKPKPRAKPAAKPAAPAVRPPVDAKAVIAASVARRQKLDEAKAAKAAADAEAARRAEAAREQREKRAAAERDRRQALADARAAAARKKAELAQTLATMSDPDEALAGAAPAPGAAAKEKPSGAGAAAALADAPPPADPGSAAGSGGGDLLDASAQGGGNGPDGSGVSYTLDGPVGSRRVLKRPVPASPDWVGTRGLDLTVIVRFQVLPDGTVKPGAVIQKTSGFPEIDRRALDALGRWLFEAVPAGDGSEVWGRVKFRFTS